MAKDSLNIDGLPIRVNQVDDQDYLSLTDIAKHRSDQEARFVIRNWLTNQSTMQFLEVWESVHNPHFNRAQFRTVMYESMGNVPSLTPKRYIDLGGIALTSKGGRYGGTYAHVDVAFEFATWMSPAFKVYLIKDYQRLKQAESIAIDREWDRARFLSKANYELQTETIKQAFTKIGEEPGFAYASEADLINLVVFGITAKQWREANPEQARKGNLREHATKRQLQVLSNMESLNSRLISLRVGKDARYHTLLEEAKRQFDIFEEVDLKKLGK